MTRVRAGLSVFRQPRLGAPPPWRSCARGRCSGSRATCCSSRSALSHQAGLAAAAAVLFAVNITAVLPATPANLGVFQAACAAVLHPGWHVGYGAGVAYGVILQAVEVSTAILMGMPALLKEGMSWREVRLRAMHAAPVKLPARAQGSSGRHGRGPRPRASSRESSSPRAGNVYPWRAKSVTQPPNDSPPANWWKTLVAARSALPGVMRGPARS